MNIAECAWPRERSGEAIASLARSAGFPLRDARLPRTDDLEHAAAWLGVETEPVESAYEDVDALVSSMAPALVDVAGRGLLAVAKSSHRRSTLLLPDGRRAQVPTSAVRAVLVGALEEKRGPLVDRILEEALVPSSRRPRARTALLGRALSLARVRGATLVRLPPGTAFAVQARAERLGSRATAIVAVHALRYVLLALGWWLVGHAALEGRMDVGLLAGWALVLVTQIPLALFAAWAQGTAAIDAGALLKRRMLSGGLAFGRDELRTEGSGHLLGRVLEAEAVESLALGAGFAAVTAFVELVVAIGMLLFGMASVVTGVVLVAWTVLMLVCCLRYARRRAAWTDARLSMTHDLVERMVGHRTRLAQEAPSRWHEEEDELLAGYVHSSDALDRLTANLWAGLPRGWLVVALASLVPSIAGGVLDAPRIAVAVGATLLAYRALRKVLTALAGAAGAAIAWQKAKPLFEAAAITAPSTAEPPPEPRRGTLRLEASGVTYRYRARGEPVLRGCSLVIDEGDRVLLEGRSGSGKSTFATILCGLREPDGGLVLVGGLDRSTLGLAGFRRHVAAAPQFHDNFLLGSTLAFNLLMGRRWPARDEDLSEAERVCRDLGLGPVLDRMPSGLMTQVGETGWQLSHGERSRVYLARALLQGARVLVLDESFGALDPPTLERAVARVLEEPSAVVVIAHP
jgi:ATP-binding cassette subfamily B protein